MKRPCLLLTAAASLLGTLMAGAALEVRIGTRATQPGGTVVLPVTLTDAPTNLSAFAFRLTQPGVLPVPIVHAGPNQPNLQAFVDNLGGGEYRVTGFVLTEPPIGTGIVATLEFNVSLATPFGLHPESFSTLPAPNPEGRTLVTSELVASTGSDGAVVVTIPPQVTHFEMHTNGAPVFHLEFDGTPGVTYSVQGSTNLVDWIHLGTATASSPAGIASYLDADVPLHPWRFYRVIAP